MKQTFLDFEQPIAELQQKIDELRFVHEDSAVDISDEIARLTKKSQQLTKEIYASSRRGRSRRSRAIRSGRTRSTTSPACSPTSASCTATAPTRDDPAIVGGLARFNGKPCMVIGHQKGRDTKEKIHRNFGMPRPEGYRKALRLMKLAEKFGLPLFTFVDTPGRVSGHRRRGARAVGGDRPQPLRNGGPAHPGDRDRDRRRRLGRRARDRHRRRHADAAVRDVLGDLARRLRVDPVEVRRACARGGRDPGHHRAAPEAARPHRQGRQRADWAAPTATTRR